MKIVKKIKEMYKLCVREDTQKISVYLVVGGTTKQKKTFFYQRKNLQTNINPLRSRGGGGCPDLSGSTTQTPLFFLCVFP